MRARPSLGCVRTGVLLLHTYMYWSVAIRLKSEQKTQGFTGFIRFPVVQSYPFSCTRPIEIFLVRIDPTKTMKNKGIYIYIYVPSLTANVDCFEGNPTPSADAEAMTHSGVVAASLDH